ncbi:MAG: nucleotidyltransferase family protein [Thiobacillus sp.]|nr:nucleotidyltransferase family protein [Thiobacillus sp.]
MTTLDLGDWDLLLRQAGAAGLLSRIAVQAETLGLDASLPDAVKPHLTAARTVATKQRQAVRWEARRVAQTLADIDGPALLLKGAAYAIAGLPPAAGRLFSDIDILVPRAQLGQVEGALLLAGWHAQKQDDYDQRYYRRWMHELPPLTHIRRGTVLDVHHNLLPETARIRTHAGPILAAAQALADLPGLSIPANTDLVLHSACHLFHEGEWGHGLRDLVDLDAMLRAFAAEPEFWPSLLARAQALNLGRPLYYALDCCRRWLHTPIPAHIIATCPSRPSPWQRPLMRQLFDAGLASALPTCQGRLVKLATFILFVRGHYLRMPWHLLLPHLLHQALRRDREKN